MKQKDIMLIVVVVFISAVASIIVSKYLIATPKNRQQEVEVVQPISSSFDKPDKRFFNEQSYNPTQNITVEENSNANPFNGATGQQ